MDDLDNVLDDDPDVLACYTRYTMRTCSLSWLENTAAHCVCLMIADYGESWNVSAEIMLRAARYELHRREKHHD